MTVGARYVKIIEWSGADKCFIGIRPELFYGGCHGEDERKVFNELCQIIDEMVALYQEDGKSLPPPISGRDLVNLLQKVA
jgi:predicted RNase H-like HicB family nuclease